MYLDETRYETRSKFIKQSDNFERDVSHDKLFFAGMVIKAPNITIHSRF